MEKFALPIGLPFWYYLFMVKSIAVLPKRRGRPATGRDPVTAIRLSPALRSRLDEWRNRQKDRPSRSQAIRQLVEQALSRSDKGSSSQKAKAGQAAELAARVIETKADKTQPVEEQKSRKRKLISGPTEFRDIRRDQAGRKS